ncbi:MAG: trehalase family glycosidase, partial [Chloroflexota bacterium]|nr:trehalase family glycosidase [Chloroflexota bacterium]
PDYDAAHSAARRALDDFEAILALRQAEAVNLYRDDVTAHQDVYQYALMNLLWNKMYYEYDGSFEPAYRDKVNVRDVILAPDKWEFPWPAMWDTAFQTKVATLADVELAKHELRVFLSDRWQLSRGHVPNCEWMMAEETPPLFAWAAWEIYQVDGDRAFLEEMWPRLELHYDYFRQALDLDHDRLYRGGFMGLDNIPRPTGDDVEQVDTSGWMALFAQRMATIAVELDNTERAEYYQNHYEQICAQMNAQLWNEEDGFYYDRDSGGHLREKSYVGLIPFISGAADAAQVERILTRLRNPEEFWSDYGIRSLSADSELYEPGYSKSGWKNSNWRGPVWLPINYLLVQAVAEHDPALAEELRGNLIAAVETEWQRTGHFFEYYHAETGEGLGADHQTGWTALVANLIHEKWGK